MENNEMVKQQLKWEGKVTAKLTGPRADQIWCFLHNGFFSLNKWLPTLYICRGVEGESGQLGCVSYCARPSIPSQDGSSVLSWCTEKLVAVDPVQRSFSYEIVHGNIGFNSYVSTIKVIDDDADNGCWNKWSFIVDPVPGWILKDLICKYELGLGNMARRMEEAALPNGVEA
ncbi:hypothetical protein GIB67_017275 [Kingdonia uniflora]|uniref:Lachrymatory-factor synthase n=1 Tax=Kingdonia uniflora TaxID=39325 RepID=A0A7J7N3E5_9MAGN|nr:hypothetical protein GIB67_017275 [Kingdonia uniflora]